MDRSFSVSRLLARNTTQQLLLRHRSTMQQISFEIENCAAATHGTTRLFSGFQTFSHFLPQIERYRALARSMESIYIFGIPDVELPPIPRIHYVSQKPADPMTCEWFVVAYGTSYASALASRAVSEAGTTSALFEGLWSFNPFIISLIGDQLSRAVNAPLIKCEIDEVLHYQHMERTALSIERLIEAIDHHDHGILNARRALLRRELADTLYGELQAILPMRAAAK